MPKRNIVIAGGGFAGVSALRRLRRHRGRIGPGYEIVVIDRKPHSEFIPMLPDVIGGLVRPETLRYPLDTLARTCGARFINAGIRKIDPARSTIETDAGPVRYEHLILATGSETNFYGNAALQKSCLKLDSVEDAVSIREAVRERARSASGVTVLVIGGGYTGIEIATSIDRLLRNRRCRHRVIIVEKRESLVAALPEWIRDTVTREVARLGIEAVCGGSLEKYDGSTAELDSGRRVENALCVWAAGLCTAGHVRELETEKEKTRVRVDASLAPVVPVGGSVLVAGDAASFRDEHTGASVRMSVMFSIGEGERAADTIARLIAGKKPAAYHPVDPGYLIPMAHGKAPGIVMGLRVGGVFGYVLHYAMCFYRSERPNKGRMIRDLVRFAKCRARAWRRAIGCIVLALSLSCYSGAAAEDADTEPCTLTFITHWSPQAQFAGYYVAKEKGFYAARGLDVEILPSGPNISAPQALAAGRADVAVLWLSQALRNRSEGVPLINIGQIVQRSGLMFVAKKAAGITAPEDLEGRKISMWSGDLRLQGEAFIKRFGLSVTKIPQAYTVNLFLAGGVDAIMAMWYNEYHTILSAGVDPEELSVFLLRDYGLNVPEDGLYMLEETYRREPVRARAFVEASIAGWIYAFDHPEEAVGIVLDRMRAANIPANRAHQKWMLTCIEDLVTGERGRTGIGVLSPEEYRAVSTLLKENGMIEDVVGFDAFFVPVGGAHAEE